MPDTLTEVAPTWSWVPEHVSTAGDDAVDLAATAGLILDAEQRRVLRAMFAERRDGKWAAYEIGLICARQNLKTVTLQAASLCDLFLIRQRLSVWTAHLFGTTQEAFRDLMGIIENHDHLRKRCKKPTTANGDEGFETLRGERLIFRARSKNAGRGLSGDVVTMDEAFAISAAEMGALLPALSARPNPQVRYASSAGMAHSEHLRSIRDRGRAAADGTTPDPTLAYLEWGGARRPCARVDCTHRYGTTDGCALDDQSLWRAANPAMGRRISAERIEAERRALPPMEFARERLGWWEEPESAELVMDMDVWEALRDPASDVPSSAAHAFALDVTPDGSAVTLLVAGARSDERVHLEVVQRWEQDWRERDVVARCRAILSRVPTAGVAVDNRGPAGAMIPALESEGLTVHRYGLAQCATGAALFLQRATQDGLRHLGSPALTTALRAAKKRSAGVDAWAWDRKSSTADISPLVAASNALLLLATADTGPSVYERRGVITL